MAIRQAPFFHQSLVHRFLSGFRVAFHLPSCAVVLDGLHPWASLRPKGGDRCCRALRLLEARASGNSLPLALFFYLSALRSSRLSTGVFTTMASADSPLALTRGVSPGKVRKLSRRAVRLYPPRFFDSLWASYSLAYLPPVAGLSVCSCPYGRRFAFGFFQLPLTGSTLPFGYGCRCRLRQTPFILIARAHAGHTRERFETVPYILPSAIHYPPSTTCSTEYTR